MGLVNHYYNYRFLEEDPGLPTRNYQFAAGDVGGLVIPSSASVLAASGRSEEAERFIAFLLSREAQEYFAEETFEYPLAQDVPPAEGVPRCRRCARPTRTRGGQGHRGDGAPDPGERAGDLGDRDGPGRRKPARARAGPARAGGAAGGAVRRPAGLPVVRNAEEGGFVDLRRRRPAGAARAQPVPGDVGGAGGRRRGHRRRLARHPHRPAGAAGHRLLLPLPLVLPSFIGAFALIAAFAPGG